MGASLAATVFALVAQGMAGILISKILPIGTAARAVVLWSVCAASLFFIAQPMAILLIGVVVMAVLAPRGWNERTAFFLVAAAALPAYLEGFIPMPGINYLIVLTHYKAAVLVLLMPLLFSEPLKGPGSKGLTVADTAIILFVFYTAIIMATHASLTGGLRFLIDQSVTFVLPFFVISRAAKTQEDVDRLIRAFVCVSLMLACAAIVSSMVRWDFYKLHAPLLIQLADFRSGFLRVEATVNTHSLGFHLSAAILLLEYLKIRDRMPVWFTVLSRCILLIGLISTDSRGSMLGLASGFAIYGVLMVKSAAIRRFFVSGALAGGAALAMWFLSADFSSLGSQDSFTYRQQLARTSIEYILANPLFGDLAYEASGYFDSLRQGQGIIDITNLYLLILLQFGFVGAILFFSALVIPMLNLYFRHRAKTPRRALYSLPMQRKKSAPTVVEPTFDPSIWRLRAILLGAGVGWLALVTTTSNVALTVHIGLVIAALSRIASALLTAPAKAALEYEPIRRHRGRDFRSVSPQSTA